ncbi:potassium channel family protein [Alkalinema pantanalense CENA528]|uniref:potassium channel family protein n=1 Tax=Alkalinema pantanalense TaxID=1620705 RepID=UPI003D6FC64D
METPVKRILTGFLVFCATLITAIAGYRAGGCTWLNSTYMVVITVFGVGYGEACPINTPQLKIFTIFVIISGTSSAVYIVGGFIQMITEGELQDVLGQRRMVRGIEMLEHHAIICGFGRIGQILARRLEEARIAFVVIDNDPDRTEIAESLGYLVKTGNAADEDILKAVGIERAHVLASVLPDDATNVFITLTARELNPELRILARGEIPSTEKKLRLAGADQVILPASISAARIAHMITHPATLDFLDEGDGRNTLNELLSKVDVQVDEVAISPNSPLLGSTVGTLEARGKGTFIIVALRKADGHMIIHPRRSLILEREDILIVMGHRGDLPKLVQRYIVKRKFNDPAYEHPEPL